MAHVAIVPSPDLVYPTNPQYSHAMAVAPDARRWLFISGQVPVRPDGSVPDGIVAQTEVIWQNVAHILDAAEMGMADVVRLTHYVTGREHLAGYNETRGRFMAGARPASTLLVISGLARPEFLVEVDVVAARA